MAKSHKSCIEQEEIIDAFGTYHVLSRGEVEEVTIVVYWLETW